MSDQTTSRAGKIVMATAVMAFLLALTATLITYFRQGKINVMPLIAGIIIPLLAITIATSKRKN